GALVAQRAVHQLGGERRVPRVQLPLLARLAQQRRQDEVGVGVPLVHGPQGLEGEDADGVLLGPTVRLAGPAGPTGLIAHGKKVLRVWGEVRAPAYVVVAGRRGPRGQAPTVSPAPMRTPRAQSAALIGFLPWACTHSSSTAWEPVPAYTLFLAADSSPGARSVRPGAGATWTSLSRSPRKVVQAPGAGVQPRTTRSTRSAGARQSTRASSTVTLGAWLTPSAGCGTACRVPSSMPSMMAASSPAPANASLVSRSPLVSVGRISSVTVPYTGPES